MNDRLQRWPLHPRPLPGEALSSWLDRVSGEHSLTLRDLLEHNLGSASIVDEGWSAADLDWDPPDRVLAEVSERTGVGAGDLRAMTFSGWVPWLMDGLDEGDQEHFDTYVRQDSVLLAPGEVGHNVVPRWRPWLAPQAVRYQCPVCADAPDRVVPLFSRLPLMLSCADHGCLVRPAGDIALAAFDGEPMPPEPARPEVVELDRRTHEAITTGRVTLPRRSVHAGVWFRLLRTLLDEVSTSLSKVRKRSQAVLQTIWEAVGTPARAGLNVWRPFEALDRDQQEAMLQAAAIAVRQTETGVITARGTLGPLLTSMPHQPVDDGTPARPTVARLPRAPQRSPADLDAVLMEVFEAAKTDQATARWILQCLTWRLRSTAGFEREREGLITTCGIPAEFLPEAHEWDFSRPGPFGIL